MIWRQFLARVKVNNRRVCSFLTYLDDRRVHEDTNYIGLLGFRARDQKLERLPFEWNFRSFFSGQMELHSFPLRKQNGLNRIILWKVADTIEPRVHLHL